MSRKRRRMKQEKFKITLSSPDVQPQDIEAVTEVLQSQWLCLGPKMTEFEAKVAAYVGVAHGVAVNSGTSALHLVVRALGLKPGDEVVTTPFSFVASANCLLFEGVKPAFVDIDPCSYNLDLNQIEAAITPNTKAILPVDVFGQPPDWDRLQAIADKHRLPVIEDSAEALGSTYKGRKAGSLGDVGVFSFYPNKQMTTGEGGMIVTDNENIARLCRSMRNQGRSEAGGWLQHERVGYNFRLSDINCALGISQLERIEATIQRRAQVAQWYAERLAALPDVYPPTISPDVRQSWFVYVVGLADRFAPEQRDAVLGKMAEKGIQCSNYFVPIHLQKPYRKLGYREGKYPVTERIAARTIALPFYNRLTEAEVDAVVDSLKAALEGV